MLGNLMNIFFDGTLEESSERQVRETTPDVMEKSSTIAQPISEKYEKDVEVHIPEHTRSLSGSLLGYKTIP